MRLGVDARLLTEKITGIGRYTFELCRHLSRINEPTFLYVPSHLPVKIQSSLTPAILKSDKAYGRVRRMLWSQTDLPNHAYHDSIEVFWGATHRIPQKLDVRIARVVTIHDLVWRTAGETMRPFSRLMESVLMPRAIAAADLIMADSKSTAQELVIYYPEAADKTRVVYLGASEFSFGESKVPHSLSKKNKDYFLPKGLNKKML